MILGIDPGLRGGYTFLGEEFAGFSAHEWRTVKEFYNRVFSIQNTYLIPQGIKITAVLEKITALPAKSTKTEAVFFQNIGAIKAVLEILNIPIIEVRPQTWQTIRGKWQLKNIDNKAKSIAAAQEIWPGYEFPHGARGKIYDGPVEAALIAYWYHKKGKLYAN